MLCQSWAFAHDFTRGCGGCGDGAGVAASLVEMVDVAILWSCNEEPLLPARNYL